jgi:formylglycine-generating enzyme required for sulfatase activity
MGTTEVTNAQYVSFLNAVATSADPYGLYNEFMTSAPWGGIERSGNAPNFTYSIKAPAQDGTYAYDDKPVVYVSAGDAMRFANWLHNGQPLGSEGTGTTEDGAYTLNGAITDLQIAATPRNADAKWVLPTEDEWYKAAYHKNDGVTANYWDYPTADDTEPDNAEPVFDSGNSANFHHFDSDGFAITDADAYIASRSAYGTFSQAGNLSEWTETMYPSVDDQGQPYRYLVTRGGGWHSGAWALHAGGWEYDPATFESHTVGFRVARLQQLLAPNGDLNGDSSVDAADYIAWRKNDGSQEGYAAWRANFGTQPGAGAISASAVPEPHAAAWLLILYACSIFVRRPRSRCL